MENGGAGKCKRRTEQAEERGNRRGKGREGEKIKKETRGEERRGKQDEKEEGGLGRGRNSDRVCCTDL